MPLSIILYLDTSQAPPPDYFGREAQAWLLKEIQQRDPQLSQRLHDEDGHKPYTVSDVFAAPDENGMSSGAYLARITAYSANLEALLEHNFLHELPERVRIWYLNFTLRGYTLDSSISPWAGQSSYAHLVQRAQGSLGRQIGMEFISPTAFRSNGKDLLVPTPMHVFRGCWQKWNAFAPEPLRMQADLFQFIESCVQVRESPALRTRRIVFAQGKRGAATGFLGRVNFTILPQAQAGAWQASWHGMAEQVRTLALFAFFCGVGHHTTIGLGQTYPAISDAENVEDCD